MRSNLILFVLVLVNQNFIGDEDEDEDDDEGGQTTDGKNWRMQHPI